MKELVEKAHFRSTASVRISFLVPVVREQRGSSVDYGGVDSTLALALAVVVENQQETGAEGKRHVLHLGRAAIGRHPNGWISLL